MYLRVKIIIKGNVQGIGFRRFLKEKALGLKLNGFAKNLSDSSVELVIEGKKGSIDKMLDVCKRGSSLSLIKDIEVKIERYKGDLNSFEIK